ncbi:Fructosamine kinase-domain-containing protein [Xylariomycetidae sp. FL2044]|nr:Fructosamine kinase-domain-containing protein [Xylariomycetidae sp. FL2044]
MDSAVFDESRGPSSTGSEQHIPDKQPNNPVNDSTPMSVKQISSRLGHTIPWDDAVVEALPAGSNFVLVERFRESAFTITGRIVALDGDGSERLYFVKIAFGEQGRIMLNGEWESSKMIHESMPDFIPKPCGFGRYKTETLGMSAYFYLSEFVDMDVVQEPDPENFAARLAAMHRLSRSPTGQFGFPVTTCDGRMAHTVEWEEDWAVFFRKLFVGVCELDVANNGPWPEMERATEQVANRVIPRLLGNLRTPEGGKIKPCIIHGDLWEGNVGVNNKTGDTLLFDAGSYFAHNEMELGHWRCEFSRVFRDQAYTQHYMKHFPPAEPQSEFDDRIRLYSLKGAINYSAGHPQNELRKTAYNNMCYLCEKYAPIDGIDRYDPGIDPTLTGACIKPHHEAGFK